MAKKTQTILGISTGTKEMGLAVMRDSRLLDWRIKTFKGQWSGIKLRKILSVIQKKSESYKVTTIAIKIPHPSRSSTALDKLVSEIKLFCEESEIKVYLFSLDNLKHRFSDTTKISKRELVAISTLYDHLLSDIQSRHDSYYMKVLEAITLVRAVSHKRR